jgi:ElaA protein
MSQRWQTSRFSDLSNTELYALMRLRQQVFVLEQRSIYVDLDGKDLDARHMMCWEGNELVAYQRLLGPGLSHPESSMGRIVVCTSARGRDLGRDLVRRGMQHNLEQWPGHDIRINAQAYLRKFYEDLGFVVDSGEYDEDGIPHMQMLYRRPGAD